MGVCSGVVEKDCRKTGLKGTSVDGSIYIGLNSRIEKDWTKEVDYCCSQWRGVVPVHDHPPL